MDTGIEPTDQPQKDDSTTVKSSPTDSDLINVVNVYHRDSTCPKDLEFFRFKDFYTYEEELVDCPKVKFHYGYRNFRVYAPKSPSKEKYSVQTFGTGSEQKTYIAFDAKLKNSKSREFRKLKRAVMKKMSESISDTRFYFKKFTPPGKKSNGIGIDAYFVMATFDQTDGDFYKKFAKYSETYPFTFMDRATGKVLDVEIPSEAEIEINEPELDPTELPVEKDENSSSQSPPNQIIPVIPEVFDLQTQNWQIPQFIGGKIPNSYMTLQTVQGLKGSDSSITIQFKTSDKEGVLLYSDSSKKSSKDFFLIYINEGRVHVMLDLGKAVQKIVTETNVLDGRTHSVTFNRVQRTFEVNIDNGLEVKTGNGAPGAINLNVDLVTHLGGIPTKSFLKLIKMVKEQEYSLSLPRKAFTGCIESLSLYDFKPDLSSNSKLIVKSMSKSITECDTGPCSLINNPCQNNSTCNVQSIDMISPNLNPLDNSPIMIQRSSNSLFSATCGCSLGYSGQFCQILDLIDYDQQNSKNLGFSSRQRNYFPFEMDRKNIERLDKRSLSSRLLLPINNFKSQLMKNQPISFSEKFIGNDFLMLDAKNRQKRHKRGNKT